jgi:uncharacterized membrane protein YcaP (DUF421 family)
MDKLFLIETSVWELLLRGSLLYLGILLLMRVLPRRAGSELATMDLIFIILIGEAAAHALGDYTSVAEGFIVIITLMAGNYIVNALSYHFTFIEKLVSAPPLQIIKEGKLLHRNMRREYITKEELLDYLRKEGIEDVNQVKAAFVESEGQITVIKKKVERDS